MGGGATAKPSVSKATGGATSKVLETGVMLTPESVVDKVGMAF